MPTTHKIVIGDCRCMSEVADASVHLVVTSPPYWQIKDYGHRGQIGFHDTYEQYVNHLALVWQECARVLHPGCRLCINVGDQFARAKHYGTYQVIPIRTEIVKACQALGLVSMGAIIWQKVTTCQTSGGATIMGSYPYPRNGIIKIDYEFILLFKKPGAAPRPLPEAKAASRLTKDEWNTCFYGHWNFPGERRHAHAAPFPEELPRRLIKMFTFVSDTVLDPFAGSGTTAVAARDLGRHSIGYEINTAYREIIETRFNEHALFPDAGTELTFVAPSTRTTDFDRRIQALPYALDPSGASPEAKASTPRRQETAGAPRPTTFRVAAVLGGDSVRLDNGATLRLLGVTVDGPRAHDAAEFLRSAAKGHRVFFQTDDAMPADDDTVTGYLYLANRTHLNAHLIKKGLARADRSREYRFRKRFIRYEAAASS